MQQPVPAQPQFAPCPKCGSTDARKVSYTWWGGFLGPSMLNHVKCNQCGSTYNSKSGKSNVTAIVIYTVVILAACLIFYFILQGLQ